MTHSIEVVRDYVCQFYGATTEEILSGSIEYRLVRARQMIVLLSGLGRDRYVAEIIGRYRCQIPVIRKTVMGNMKYDKVLRAEFERLEKGLLAYEISDFSKRIYVSQKNIA